MIEFKQYNLKIVDITEWSLAEFIFMLIKQREIELKNNVNEERITSTNISPELIYQLITENEEVEMSLRFIDHCTGINVPQAILTTDTWTVTYIGFEDKVVCKYSNTDGDEFKFSWDLELLITYM